MKIIAMPSIELPIYKLAPLISSLKSALSLLLVLKFAVLRCIRSICSGQIDNTLIVLLLLLVWSSLFCLVSSFVYVLFCLVTYAVVLTGDVFAGVGPIALAAARIVKRVYANDLNPHAVEFMEQNSVVNKLEKRIEIFNMDGRRFIKAMFSSEKGQKVTQVVMNLPKDAAESLGFLYTSYLSFLFSGSQSPLNRH
jgi:hypothetical protein